MALSESAEKGRAASSAAALLCGIGSVLSLLTLAIPLAVIGFWAAGGIKKGNFAARNIGILLRIADMPFMLIIWFAVRTAGVSEPLNTVVIAVTAAAVLIDVLSLIMLIGNKNLKQYFRETVKAESDQAIE
ncbi:MAG: hypothetical protein K2J73_06095 [Oscillospiraceae bacterium]|nr:hypothetical protein [Oscillospiraceae bacterium]